MQSLAAYGRAPRGLRPWMLVVALALAAALGAGLTLAISGGGGKASTPTTTTVPGGGGAHGGGRARHVTTTTAAADPFKVLSVTPAGGTQTVPSNTTVTVDFTQPLVTGTPLPTLDPAVAGHWVRVGKSSLVFHPDAPFAPFTTEVLTIPGGSAGMRGAGGMRLEGTMAVTFTIVTGSATRLEQLLAVLGYLPLAYATPPGLPAQDMATAQPGTLTWRWTLPPQLESLWTPGHFGPITKGAVMTFENQNGLTVDGLAGPVVWQTLLADVAAKKGDTTSWDWVYVSKTEPENLTVFVNGAALFPDIPVNTGVPGVTTTDGTFQVFEHVKASDMKGTNITGSTYTDPTVPWASYFDGGEALHGFPRANYGYPQSNGCVEMPITTAGKVWPYTPIGTLVTVAGPPAPGPVPTTTTTTTTPPPPSTP